MFKIFKKKNIEKEKLYSFDFTKEQVEFIKTAALFGHIAGGKENERIRHEIYDIVKDIKFI